MNKRKTGAGYEKAAGSFLEGKGYRILEYNFRNRKGEIDIIAREDDTLVFIEVKYRSGKGYGDPGEAVNRSKQKIISQVAAFYLIRHGYSMETKCRFDVVAICRDQIRLIRNAFFFQGWS